MVGRLVGRRREDRPIRWRRQRLLHHIGIVVDIGRCRRIGVGIVVAVTQHLIIHSVHWRSVTVILRISNETWIYVTTRRNLITSIQVSTRIQITHIKIVLAVLNTTKWVVAQTP